MAYQSKVGASTLMRARLLIVRYTKELGDREGWQGIAPSYLCEKLHISYERMCLTLLELEEAGFIYDNGHGSHFNLPDGRRYATRYYMKDSIP